MFCFDLPIPHAKGVLYPKGYYRGPRREGRLGLFFPKRKHLLELRVKVPKKVIDPLKPSEVDEFLKDIRRYRDLAIVLIMLFCGLRSQEALLLRVEDVDFIKCQVRVRGKGNKERIVPLPYQLMQLFDKYLTHERQSSGDRFFVVLQGKNSGKSMTPSGLRSLFRYRSFVTQIARAKPHQFRHAFASDMARAGVPLTTIQRLLGHSDPSTSEIYIQLCLDDIRADYERAIKRIGNRYAAIAL